MKSTMLGALAGTGLLLMAMGVLDRGTEAQAQWPPSSASRAGSSGELIALSSPAGDACDLVTVIDPKARTMCVYQIEKATGKIALRGVRNISWDLQMTYYNNEKPLPQDVQAMLAPR